MLPSTGSVLPPDTSPRASLCQQPMTLLEPAGLQAEHLEGATSDLLIFLSPLCGLNGQATQLFKNTIKNQGACAARSVERLPRSQFRS